MRLLPGVQLAKLLKVFDDSQPRDEHGRWAAAAGDGAPTAQAHGMRAAAGISTPSAQHMGSLNSDHLSRLGPTAAVQLQSMYHAAADAKPAFDKSLTEIAQQVGGEAKLPGLKGSDRATEKILQDYNGNAGQIKDLLRGTVEVKTVADAQAALKDIQAKYDVLPTGFRNLLTPDANPADGYRDIKMNVKVGGVVAEVQINVPALLSVKSENHVLYEQRRSLEGKIYAEGRDATASEAAQISKLNASMKDAYTAVWDKIKGP